MELEKDYNGNSTRVDCRRKGVEVGEPEKREIKEMFYP